jgi:hypothetical protein
LDWIENGLYLKHLCTWKLDWVIFTLKCMTDKITLNYLKMAERLSEENCVKIVKFFFD